jgi:hypothetical protein
MSTDAPITTPEPSQKQFSFYALSSTIAGALSYLLIFFHSLIDMSFIWAAILAPITAIVAIITGTRGKREIRKAEGNMSGKKLANAGLILGYVYIGICILLLAGVVFGIVKGSELISQSFGL